MTEETIGYYSILFQHLLRLKEPTYIFLIQIFHHLSPSKWWEEFIEPVVRNQKKENFKYLDMPDLLNIFKINWEKIFKYLDKDYEKFKYDNEYRLVSKVHSIRTVVAHANDIDMTAYIFSDSLFTLLKYTKLIQAGDELIQMLEADSNKYRIQMPKSMMKKTREESQKAKILSVIEDKVLLKAKSCENLPSDIRLSIDRTIQRLHSMRTLDEVIGLFNNSMHTERGITVSTAMHSEKLLAFEDIKDEINGIYSA